MDARFQSALVVIVIAAAAFYGYSWWQAEKGGGPLRFSDLSRDEFFDVYERVEPPAADCTANYSGMLRTWNQRTQKGVNQRDCRQLRILYQELSNVSTPCETAFANLQRLYENNQLRFESNESMWLSYARIQKVTEDLALFSAKANRVMATCR